MKVAVSSWPTPQPVTLTIQAHAVDSGSLEIDLVGLCAPGATCTPALAPVMDIHGELPVGYILSLD